MKLIHSRNGIMFVSLLVLIVCIVVLWLLPRRVSLDTLGIGRASAGVVQLVGEAEATVNQPYRVSVQIDTQGSAVNAVGIYLRYNPDSLQLLQMDTKSSFCQFYPEKKYDNNLGTVSLACGSPHPGVEGIDTLMELEFLPKQLGSSTIYVTEKSQLLKSDGKGTNILTDYPSLEVVSTNTL